MNKKIDTIWPAVIILLPGIITFFLFLVGYIGVHSSRFYSDVSISFAFMPIYFIFGGPLAYILLGASEYKKSAIFLKILLAINILLIGFMMTGYRLF